MNCSSKYGKDEYLYLIPLEKLKFELNLIFFSGRGGSFFGRDVGAFVIIFFNSINFLNSVKISGIFSSSNGRSLRSIIEDCQTVSTEIPILLMDISSSNSSGLTIFSKIILVASIASDIFFISSQILPFTSRRSELSDLR